MTTKYVRYGREGWDVTGPVVCILPFIRMVCGIVLSFYSICMASSSSVIAIIVILFVYAGCHSCMYVGCRMSCMYVYVDCQLLDGEWLL